MAHSRLHSRLFLAAGLVLGGAGIAQAAVVRVSEDAFQAGSGLISNSEVPLGTINPIFAPGDYGGGDASPTVTSGGYFVGQSLSIDPNADCPGAAASACVVGDPTGALSIDPDSPDVFTADDTSTPTTPTLSGSPLFNGPIALLFSEDQFGVGFTAGFFNAVGSTGITAFARDGSLLGTVVNEGMGVEFLGLVSQEADIAGVFLDLVGSEPAGFVIDNIRFGVQGQVIPEPLPNPVPLPAGLPLLAAGLGGLALLRSRRT